MSDFLQDVNLTCDSFNVAFIFDPVFLQNFDGNFFACNGMSANPHFSEGSGTKWSS